MKNKLIVLVAGIFVIAVTFSAFFLMMVVQPAVPIGA